MIELYFWLFLAICFGLLGWGMTRPDRIYQYPFLMGGIFVSFILPQAVALINNPAAVGQQALERVLLMTCLCAAMCWVGYQYTTNTTLLKKLCIPLDERKLFLVGIILTIIGYFFSFLISITNIQLSQSGTWTGPATIYIFFFQAIFIGFAIFTIAAFKKPSFVNITAAIIAGYPIFVQAFIMGRRQRTFTFLIIIGITLFYVRRLLPPRILILGLVVAGAFLIPLVGLMRGGAWTAISSGNFSTIIFQESLNKVLQGEILELRNAAILMDLASWTNKFGFGRGFWDDIVFQYVPGQILGYDFKESLQFNVLPYESTILLGYTIHTGTTPTGIGDSFLEFNYFGCLIFGIIAYFFKHIWISSVYQRSVFSQILYAGMVSPALISLTHGVGRFIQEAIFQVMSVILIAYFSRVKK